MTVEELARRLERLEGQNSRLGEENQDLRRRLDDVTRRYDDLSRRLETQSPPPPLPNPALPAVTCEPDPFWGPRPEAPAPARRFVVGERDEALGAFVLVRPTDPDRTPYELRADVFTQARYFNFGRSAEVWYDSTGAAQPVRNVSSVEVNRNFIQLSGFALDPRLQFNAIVFSSTTINDTVYLGWVNYRFSEAFDLRVGNWVLPGTREWLESFRYTMGAERLMATTFFRPNISPGVWAQGEPVKGLKYVAMVANSFNRFNQGIERLGQGAAFGGTVWWEPTADFGPGPSDVEHHDRLSPRLGTSLTVSREANQAASLTGPRNPEDTILRLSDGTPLFRAGALGPGTTLTSTGVQLWAVDAALKYHGFALSGEYFFRRLDGFRYAGPAPRASSLFDHGGLLQGGYFVVPGRVEAYARTSFVTGPFGTGGEFGGGLNWYVQGARDWRLTFEALRINHSPAQNVLTGYRAGESGMLYQLQWFTDF